MLDEREHLQFEHLHHLRDVMATPGHQDGGQLPGSLANHFAHGQVHPWPAIERGAEQLKRVAVRLDVRHDVHGLGERDLVRSARIVQLGLALLGLGHDGVDAGIVFEYLETIQIVCGDDSHEACLMGCAPGIVVERFHKVEPITVPWKTMFLRSIFVRALAIHDHLCSTLLQPRTHKATILV